MVRMGCGLGRMKFEYSKNLEPEGIMLVSIQASVVCLKKPPKYPPSLREP